MQKIDKDEREADNIMARHADQSFADWTARTPCLKRKP